MKAIKCPNCGSEQVKELTEEKYACMACDNVFLIHNHSKEFRKTDEHISSMHPVSYTHLTLPTTSRV